MDESNPSSVLFSPGESFHSVSLRFVRGLGPLIAYGALGTFEQTIVAPTQYQVPLVGGFTLPTPWADPPLDYVRGVPGQSQDFQLAAHLAGQSVDPFDLVRTHTTGILDYGVRHSWPYASDAEELVHPGYVQLIKRERW